MRRPSQNGEDRDWHRGRGRFAHVPPRCRQFLSSVPCAFRPLRVRPVCSQPPRISCAAEDCRGRKRARSRLPAASLARRARSCRFPANGSTLPRVGGADRSSERGAILRGKSPRRQRADRIRALGHCAADRPREATAVALRTLRPCTRDRRAPIPTGSRCNAQRVRASASSGRKSHPRASCSRGYCGVASSSSQIDTEQNIVAGGGNCTRAYSQPSGLALAVPATCRNRDSSVLNSCSWNETTPSSAHAPISPSHTR